MKQVFLVTTNAQEAAANSFVRYVFGDLSNVDQFTVQLSANGLDPATHQGCAFHLNSQERVDRFESYLPFSGDLSNLKYFIKEYPSGEYPENYPIIENNLNPTLNGTIYEFTDVIAAMGLIRIQPVMD